jgi:hypothetical protein
MIAVSDVTAVISTGKISTIDKRKTAKDLKMGFNFLRMMAKTTQNGIKQKAK